MSKLLRSVNTAFWSDPYIEKLVPEGKLLFLYLLTNSNANMLGIYEITVKKITYDTEIDTVEELLEKFKTDKKIYYVNNFVILKNFTKNQSYNPKMVIGAFDIFSKLPSHLLKYIFLEDTLCIPYITLFDTLSIPYKTKFYTLCKPFDNRNIIGSIIRIEYECNDFEIENGTLNQTLTCENKIEFFRAFKEQFKTDTLLENTRKGLNKNPEKSEALVDKFLNEIKLSEEYLQGLKKMKVYFKNWANKQI